MISRWYQMVPHGHEKPPTRSGPERPRRWLDCLARPRSTKCHKAMAKPLDATAVDQWIPVASGGSAEPWVQLVLPFATVGVPTRKISTRSTGIPVILGTAPLGAQFQWSKMSKSCGNGVPLTRMISTVSAGHL